MWVLCFGAATVPAGMAAPSAVAPVAVPVAVAAAVPAAVKASAAAPACPGPTLAFTTLAPGLWLLQAAPGAPDADNRGRVANLLLARQGQGLWVLGSGPSPALGRALACQARRALGDPVVATISPWARPELVLGVAGLQAAARAGGTAPVAHWAHRDVAAAMAAQCPRCTPRLRGQLGAAGADLGGDPIRLPQRRLAGEQGQLGPWAWWRLPRAAGQWVTVWRWQHGPWWFAPGLLAGPAVPDGHDADLALLQASVARLPVLAAADGAAAQWLGDQGGPQAADAPARTAAYWQALDEAVTAAITDGRPETDPPAPLAGQPAAWLASAQHGLNWQRAWRQKEPALLGTPGR